jgi:hypothetical protein
VKIGNSTHPKRASCPYRATSVAATMVSVRSNLTRVTIIGGLGLALTIGLMGVGGNPASASILTPPIWSAIANPNPANASTSSLGGVACPDASHCIAVGSYSTISTTTSTTATLVETSNGTTWSIVPSPNPTGSTNAALEGISCISTSDCIAVGSSGDQSGLTVPLAESWNGTTWSIVNVPGVWTGVNGLNGISCSGPSACFAVGSQAPNGYGFTPTTTLIERWNGSTWSVSPNPNPNAESASLSGLSCAGANACYAVGRSGASNGSSSQTLVEVWNGASWSITPSPNVLAYPSSLAGISCTSETWCTAVGGWLGSSYSETLVETWNGSSWSIVPSPNASPGHAANGLSAISCVSAAFCAAVGSESGVVTAFSIPYALIETWNGSSWVIGSPWGPSPPLNGTACSGALICTAVGGEASPDGSKLSVVESTYGQVRTSQVVGMAGDSKTGGYREAGADGAIAAFGTSYLGSLGGVSLNQPIVGTASTPSGDGYWEVASDGGIFSFGDAQFYGSTGAIHLNKPIVGMASTPDGGGYWLVASDGGIFSFGDARFYGSTGSLRLNQPVTGMASAPDGGGYWVVAADGGIFSFGDAQFYGSTGSLRLNKPIVGMASMTSGKGYWLVASDGGIFSFGHAQFYGSMGSVQLNQPVVGMTSASDGAGYWLVAADGGIFSFGSVHFFGSWQ